MPTWSKGLAAITLLIMVLLVVICVWAHFDSSMAELCKTLESIALAATGASIATYLFAEATRLQGGPFN
jgi:hypothetical protein